MGGGGFRRERGQNGRQYGGGGGQHLKRADRRQGHLMPEKIPLRRIGQQRFGQVGVGRAAIMVLVLGRVKTADGRPRVQLGHMAEVGRGVVVQNSGVIDSEMHLGAEAQPEREDTAKYEVCHVHDRSIDPESHG